MALRFIDGTSHYSTAQINQKWNSSGGAAIVSAAGRFGGNCLTVDAFADSGSLAKTFDAQVKWVVGFAIQPPGFPTTSAVICQIKDSSSVQVDLRVNADGTLSVTRDGTALTDGTSTFALSVGTWYFVEFKVTIANAIGASTCRVYVNGAVVITVATGQDTQATANATANNLVLAGTADDTPLCDIYICDGTGATNNNQLGDCRVHLMFPNAAGDATDFTATGAANNFTAAKTNPPISTKYVSADTINDTDLYNLQNLSLTGTIYGIQTALFASKSDAGARTIAAVVKTGGTEFDGATVSPSTSYIFFTEVRETNPDTAVAWIAADLTALQAGPKIIT